MNVNVKKIDFLKTIIWFTIIHFIVYYIVNAMIPDEIEIWLTGLVLLFIFSVVFYFFDFENPIFNIILKSAIAFSVNMILVDFTQLLEALGIITVL